MSGDDRGPLHRWSERKAKAREAEVAPSIEETVEQPVATIEPEAEKEAEKTAAIVEQLPDIDSLTAESDYTAFMGEGVPEHLKRLALRKLWRSDPVLANVDGLVDYGEDFKVAELMGDAVKTAYRVGKGLIDDAEELPQDEDRDEDDDLSESVVAQTPPEEGEETAEEG